jgi:hypothetical protein
MPERESKPEQPGTNPDQLAKLLEIELMQKRAAWQQASARRGTYRTLSFLFLFLVIVAILLAFFVVMPRLREQHPGRSDVPADSVP